MTRTGARTTDDVAEFDVQHLHDLHGIACEQRTMADRCVVVSCESVMHCSGEWRRFEVRQRDVHAQSGAFPNMCN